jgi:DNA-binding transcriptional regulator YbjK
MTARRLDPERRQRIIAAALDVIALQGVAGCTHRSVAAHADVPLGSMTYHFASREQLVDEAFGLLAARMMQRWQAQLADAQDAGQLLDALVEWVCAQDGSDAQTLVPMMELYVHAARHPQARQLISDWMAQVQAVLGRHFDAATARALDAVIEGITLHNIFSGGAIARAQVSQMLARIAGGGDRR